MKPQGRFEKWFLASAFALLAGAASAQIQLGREFQRVEPPHPTPAGNRVEVIEFFYYGCPVCYKPSRFFPAGLARLRNMSRSVACLRFPPRRGDPWLNCSITLDALGQIGRLHWPGLRQLPLRRR